MHIAVLLVSVFLSAAPDCSTQLPPTFTSTSTVTRNVSVCMTAPPMCGITYALEILPATNPMRVNSRMDPLPGTDMTAAATFPFNLGPTAPLDFGFTHINNRAFPAMTKAEIARFNVTHTGVAGTTYTLRLGGGASIVALDRFGNCTYSATPEPQFIEVPLDGKVPPLSSQGLTAK